MHSFQQLLDLAEHELSALGLPATPGLLYDPVRYALTDGGKRLRPVALLMASDLFGGDVKKAVPAALALEMFHNFTLLHDDIMDQAPTRRGKPSVYRKWDESTAILSGDAMLVWSYRLLAETESGALPRVLRIFNELAIGVCEGQSLDMEYSTRPTVTPGEYLRMIELKTAVLLAGAFQIGAILGGASDKQAEILYRFGMHIGTGFQIQDDLLDTYSDTVTLGKPIGGDILEGKKTFLLTHALERADSGQRTELTNILQDSDMIPAIKIESAREIYNRLGIWELAEKEVKKHFDEADALLDQLEVPALRLAPLREFTALLTGRRK